jgi:hypothetical protein
MSAANTRARVPAAMGKTGYWAVVMAVSIEVADWSVHRCNSGFQPPGFRRALRSTINMRAPY